MTSTWYHKITVSTSKAFVIGITLNLIFVLIEFSTGFFLNSLALISDAGHNLSDVASLTLALVAYNLARVKPNQTFTYGLGKSTVLISLVNAVILMIVIGAIAWESIARLRVTKVVEGDSIALVAGIGIVINAITALLFFKERKKDLNIKGAFLHMAADTLVSLGVVCTGLLISFTHWYWMDTAMSLAIVLVILVSTWGLLRDSAVLALDGVPKGIDLEKVRSEMMKPEEVKQVHHIHVWAMSTTGNALTAHVIVASDFPLSGLESLKNRMKTDLAMLKIQHVTLEFELESEPCVKEDC